MTRNEHAVTLNISESMPRWDCILEGVREHRDEWASATPVSH